MARREARKSRIPSTKASKAPRVESLHICNDSTGAQVKERVKEHIQASKPSNIIATSHYGVLAVVDGWRVIDDDDYRQAVGKPQAEGMMSTAASVSLG
jgi:hypothetical protein